MVIVEQQLLTLIRQWLPFANRAGAMQQGQTSTSALLTAYADLMQFPEFRAIPANLFPRSDVLKLIVTVM
jgi:hypothetical protein